MRVSFQAIKQSIRNLLGGVPAAQITQPLLGNDNSGNSQLKKTPGRIYFGDYNWCLSADRDKKSWWYLMGFNK